MLLVVEVPTTLEVFTLVYADGFRRHWRVGSGGRNAAGTWYYDPAEQGIASGPVMRRSFFLCGSPKSGTTWLENVLNGHPDILCVGEGHFMRAAAPDGVARMYRADFLHWYPRMTDGYMEALVFRALASDCFEQMGSCWQGPVIGDRTPENIRHLHAIRAAMPEARVIASVRHPLDVAVSRAFHEWNLLRSDRRELCQAPEAILRHLSRVIDAAHGVNVGELFSTGTEDTMRWFLDEWLCENEVVCRYWDEDWLCVVRYEDLWTMPNQVGHRVLAFLNVDDTPAMVGHWLEYGAFERHAQGRARGVEDVRSFYRKGVCGDYTNYLTPRQVAASGAYLQSAGGEVLGRLGYRIAI